MPSPDDIATPPGMVDLVATFRYPRRVVRSAVFRGADEAAATALVHAATQPGGTWAGWSIVDVMTLQEALSR